MTILLFYVNGENWEKRRPSGESAKDSIIKPTKSSMGILYDGDTEIHQ